jgi:hypothetical protein
VTYSDYVESVYTTISEGLNTFLAEKGLAPVEFCDNSFIVRNSDRTLAIYPASPNGEVYAEDANGTATAYTTLEFFYSELQSAEDTKMATKYFAAIIEYLRQTRFSEHDFIETSMLARMDQNFDFNGGAILIRSRIETQIDYAY